MSGSVIDARALRSCLGRFATGVAVVTFDSDGGRRGITVNSFTSVSVQPPLVLICVAKRARSHDALRGRAFCVNVLGAEQQQLALQFAGSSNGDQQVAWLEGDGAPRLPGVLAHLECRPWRDYDGGDHTLFLGEVSDFGFRAGDALAFQASSYTRIVETEPGIEDLI